MFKSRLEPEENIDISHRAKEDDCSRPGGEFLDGLDILVCRLDPVHGDVEPSELHRFLGKLELLRGEHHPILVAVGQDCTDPEEG